MVVLYTVDLGIIPRVDLDLGIIPRFDPDLGIIPRFDLTTQDWTGRVGIVGISWTCGGSWGLVRARGDWARARGDLLDE